MINPTTHAITEFSSGLSASSALGGSRRARTETSVRQQGATPAIGKITPRPTRSPSSVPASTRAASRAGWGPARTATPGSPTRARSRQSGGSVWVPRPRSVTPPSVSVSGGVGSRRSVEAIVWSTWAGQQPIAQRVRFDGYRGCSTAARSRCEWHVLHPTRRRLRATALVPGNGHLHAFPVTVSATARRCMVKGAAEQLDEPSPPPSRASAPARASPPRCSAIRGLPRRGRPRWTRAPR
jgi:hypothetical protein